MISSGTGVGIYVGTRYFYIAESQKQFGQVRLLRTFTHVLPALSEEPTEEERKIASQAMREALIQSGINMHARVYAAVPENETMVRFFEMPLLPKREWYASVRFEAQKFVPFDVNDLYSDFKVETLKKEKRMRTTFVAVRRLVLDRLVERLHESGVSSQGAEPAYIALYRSLQMEHVKPDEVIAVVDVDDEGAMNIFVMRGNMLLMGRHCLVSRFPNMQEKTAPVLESLLPEIHLSFNYFYKNFKGGKISRIILPCELSEGFQGWDELIKNEFDIPTEVRNPLRIFKAKDAGYSSGLSAAIGLSLSALSVNKKISINLIPAAALRQAQAEAQQASADHEKEILQNVLTIELIIAIMILGAVYLGLSVRAKSIDKNVVAARSQYEQFAGSLGPLTVADLEKAKADTMRQNSYLENLVQNRTFFTNKMNRMAELVPQEITLTGFEYRDTTNAQGASVTRLRLEGHVAADRDENALAAVNRFNESLNKDQDFMRALSEIKIVSVQKGAQEGTTRFTMEAVDSENSRKGPFLAR